VWSPPGTPWLLSLVGGARSEQRVAVAKLSEVDLTGGGKTPWHAVSEYADGVQTAVVHGDRIYMLAFGGAPNRRVISVPVAHPDLAKARVEIAEDPDVPIVGTWPARDALYVLRRVNGRAQLLRWAWGGKLEPLALPADGWVPDVATDVQRDGAVFQIETWLAPGTYYRYDPKKRAIAPIGLASTTTADFSHIVAEEVEAANADGTKVPLTILHAKDQPLDGSHASLVYAYGAYGNSQDPYFTAWRLAWLERGGIYAYAHVRGGGERGRRWQDDGSHDKKLNGVHDFEACTEYLVAHGYTSRGKIAAQGGSMGGLLIGRVITDRPDLYTAANVAVGFVNPTRLMSAENGANQKAELGDPATEAGYRALHAMDPYLHVARTAYPAVIFTVGLHDHRVAPWMTAKMAARMLASNTSARPILVRLDPDAGHGHGSTREQSFAERADVWSFFLAAMGDPEFTPR
jgi:prolyl oligopeptidase